MALCGEDEALQERTQQAAEDRAAWAGAHLSGEMAGGPERQKAVDTSLLS